MRIHEIPMMTTWYSLLGMVLYDFIALAAGTSPAIIYSRLGAVVKDVYVGISILLSVILCVVLLIVDIDHPVEIVLFYLFLFVSFLYPSIVLALAAIQKIRKRPLSGEKVVASLKQHLGKDNVPGVENCLKLLHRCDEVEDKILLQTLCDRRPPIRMAAAETGRQLGLDQKMIACVDGNNSDFKKLSLLKDKRIAPYLTNHIGYLLDKAEQKKGKKRKPLLIGALECLDGIEMDAPMLSRFVKMYKTGDEDIKTSFLKKIFPADRNKAKIYEAILNGPARKSAMLAAKKFWESSKTQGVGGADRAACERVFWEKFHMISAPDLCSIKAGNRKEAAVLASLFSGNEFYTNEITGDPSDFENIALHGEPWLVLNLLSQLQSNDDPAFFAAVRGVTALVESGMAPAGLIQWLDGKGAESVDSNSDAAPVPVSGEIRSKLREKIGGRVEKGLLSRKAQLRTSMVRTAKALDMDIGSLAMITGDENDFQQVAESADPQLQEKLIGLVTSGSSQALSIVKGLIHLWTRDAVLSESGQYHLPSLVRDAGSEVVHFVVDALIDIKDISAIVDLLTSHDDRIAHRVSRPLRMVKIKAANALGTDGWKKIESLLPQKQTVAKEAQYPQQKDAVEKEVRYPHLKAHQLSPNLVDSSSLQPSGSGDADFQMAVSAINSSDSGTAEKQFRSAIEKGLDDLRAGYAKANIGQLCLQRKNLAEAVYMFVSVLDADRVLYESAHEAAGYLSEIYKALGRTEESAGLERITAKTTAKLGVSLDPNVAARIQDLVKTQTQKSAAESTEKLIKKSVKELVAECEWHFNNAERYEALKHEFKRRENDIVRPIGKKLHEAGGMALMRKVYEEVEEVIYLKYQKRCSSALEMKWSRIGEWR